MTVSTISVPDMHCSACSSRIRRALGDLVGVQATHFNPTRRQVLVEHDAGVAALDLLRRIEDAGFTPTLTAVEAHDASQKRLLKRLGIAGLAMMQVMMAAVALYAGAFEGIDDAYRRLLEFASLLFCIPVVSYSAMPFFTGAFRAFRTGVNMDVPIALAISVAFLVSLTNTLTGSGHVYYDSVVMFTFLLLGARYIDSRLQGRFATTDQALSALPAEALRIGTGGHERIAVAEIRPGDRIWVPEGGQLPADGVLRSELAVTDDALLTGESDWLRKATGAALWAGTVNRGPGFEMEAAATSSGSRIADIAALAAKAQLERAPVALLADRIAAWFIPAILCLAATTFVIWQFVDPERALVAMLTVLVVSCPCALSLATPAALTAAMTRLREAGVVLTRSAALEQAADVDIALLDKTGSLTVHEPHVEAVEILAPGWDEARCRALAGALQQHSAHPYASAFPVTGTLAVSDVETLTGQGVSASSDGSPVRIGSAAFCGAVGAADDRAVYLAVAGRPVCRFVISDEIRSDAEQSVRCLRRLGVEPVMLSGDAEDRCESVASQLGMRYLARQSPEAKLDYLKAARSKGHHTLMLGDGINDVPVLAGADVSATVVEASDLVKSKADALLLTRRLEPLAELIEVARQTRRITRQNLAWALAYNLVAIPVAAMGFLPPWLAALGMASSSTLVMFNATRILR